MTIDPSEGKRHCESQTAKANEIHLPRQTGIDSNSFSLFAQMAGRIKYILAILQMSTLRHHGYYSFITALTLIETEQT